MKVRGVGETIRKLSSLSGADFTRVVGNTSMAAALQTRTTAVKSIQTQSMGAVVKRQRQGGRMRSHVASRPGDPPNTDTGALVRSIATQKRGNTGAMVGTSIKYGKFLEIGTRFMKARPWLGPADEKTNLVEIATKMIQHFLKGALK